MIEIKLGQTSNLNGTIVLGYFDCVHIGHCALIKEGKRENDAYCFTFNTDISEQLPKKSPNVYSYKERLVRFEEEGAKGVIYTPFNSQIMEMEAQDFLDEICKTINVQKAVCGKDFRFGKKGSGDVLFLEEYFSKIGVPTVIVQDVKTDGKKVSTGLVFERLQNGEIEKANLLLGQNYRKFTKVKKVNEVEGKTEFLSISGDFRLKEGNYKGILQGEEVDILLRGNIAFVNKIIENQSDIFTLTFTKKGTKL